MRAISSFSLDAGISTFWCRALIALRMRASMSATGSVNFIGLLLLDRPFALALTAEEPAATRLQSCIPGRYAGTSFLPGRLRNTRNLSAQRQAAETQAAKAELAEKRARASADLAAVMLARRKLGLACVLDSFCGCGHFAP